MTGATNGFQEDFNADIGGASSIPLSAFNFHSQWGRCVCVNKGEMGLHYNAAAL